VNATDINTTRAARSLATVMVVSALTLGFAVALAALATDVISGGTFAWLGDYIMKVGEALGGG
jgi:hypothetical protein